MASNENQLNVNNSSHNNGWRTFGIIIITVLVTLGVGYWVFTSYLFPTSFKPVELTKKEQVVFDNKVQRLKQTSSNSKNTNAKPEKYTERDDDRNIFFTERELNAVLANSTDLANKLVIDLSENLASAKLLIDLDPDFPFLGGKTLKVSAGMEMRFRDGKPTAILKGVSVWGVPLPNAWLGNMKNIDLVKEFGQSDGFWKSFSDGIDFIKIKESKLYIKLKA